MISPAYPQGYAVPGAPNAAPVLPASHAVAGVNALAAAVAN